MNLALLAGTAAPPDLASTVRSVLGCLISLFVLAAIPLAAYTAIRIRQRFGRAHGKSDPMNYRQAGKTPVGASRPGSGIP